MSAKNATGFLAPGLSPLFWFQVCVKPLTIRLHEITAATQITAVCAWRRTSNDTQMEPEVIELNSDAEDDRVVVVQQRGQQRGRRHRRPAEDEVVITGQQPARAPLREHSAGFRVHLPDRVIELPGQAPAHERATFQRQNEERDRRLEEAAQLRARQARQNAVLQQEERQRAAREEAQARAEAGRRAAQERQPYYRLRGVHHYDDDHNGYDDDDYISEDDADYYDGAHVEDIGRWGNGLFHGSFGANGVFGAGLMVPQDIDRRLQQLMINQMYARGINIGGGGGGDAVPPEILRQIEESENAIMDQRRTQNLGATRVLRQNIRKELKSLPKGFSSAIEENEEYGCVLCGTTLGVGIPDDFKPGAYSKPFGAMREMYDCNAPYQAVHYLTTADRDLSKRIFACSCGHVYCGRCVNAITNIKQRLQDAKKKKMKKTTMDINNPYIFAPLNCVATGCKESTKGQKKFVEIFL